MTPVETRGPARRFFRVDPRFVHATIVNNWVPATSARVAIVVDPEVALDPKRRAIFETSAMGTVDVLFCDETNAAATLATCSPTDPVIVLFSTLASALRAIEAGLSVEKINVGHVPVGPGRKELHPAVHLGDQDYALIDELQTRGIEVHVQPLPHDKLRILPKRQSAPEALTGPTAHAVRLEKRFQVVNEKGLHLRAAHVLAHLTTGIASDVQIGTKGNMVNGKSLLGLTTLGATCGTWLNVVVDGADAQAAIDSIERLFASGFEEGVDKNPDAGESER